MNLLWCIPKFFLELFFRLCFWVFVLVCLPSMNCNYRLIDWLIDWMIWVSFHFSPFLVTVSGVDRAIRPRKSPQFGACTERAVFGCAAGAAERRFPGQWRHGPREQLTNVGWRVRGRRPVPGWAVRMERLLSLRFQFFLFSLFVFWGKKGKKMFFSLHFINCRGRLVRGTWSSVMTSHFFSRFPTVCCIVVAHSWLEDSLRRSMWL